jgi:hypothetical protein
LILGKSGSTIKNISLESGAKIAMSTKEEALFTQERIITIAGTVAECIACTDLIISKLAEQEEVVPFSNRGTTYSSPLTATLGISSSDHHHHSSSNHHSSSSSHHHSESGGGGRGGGGRGSRGPRGGGGGGHTEGGRDHDMGGSDMMIPVADTTITLSVPDDLIGNIFGKQVKQSLSFPLLFFTYLHY